MRLTPPKFSEKPATKDISPPSLKARHRWLRNPRFAIACTAAVAILAGAVHAGDILRGGATASSGRKNADARANAGSEAAATVQTRAQDRLARTTKAVNDMRNLQAAARAAAAANTGGIPDGLAVDGLDPVKPGELNFRWEGANAPVQNGNEVTIKQNLQQAVLHWRTLNVGKNTQLTFDQSAGGNDVGKWIAFNKVFDPTARPSQIRGQIKADGQVYIINQNGIIFGAGSQVNARTLVASSLPINDNLVKQGLLNLTSDAAEFLFQDLASQTSVIVEKGAQITGTTSPEGSGGRVVLVGASVVNDGIISTPSGQTILAAGLQVGFDVHSKEYPVIPSRKTTQGTEDDPSLRGIDAYVGEAGESGGTVVNSGMVEIPTGSLIMVGKTVEQNGVIESSTTVSLNGRIDLLANYGAVANPSYDPDIKNQLSFLNTSTGTVRIGAGSSMSILPDYLSKSTTIGTNLPIKSQVNFQGNLIVMESGAMLLAPNGDIAVAAGQWRPVAQQTNEQFSYTSGQFFMDSGSFIDAAGSTDVFVPISNRILKVELRGSELALSPLQRDGPIRAEELTIDTRRTGAYNGQYWVGTPLGDAAGFLDVIQKNAAQLTAEGGSVRIQAGSSFVAQRGSVIDVSGGYYRHEGGKVETTRLRQGGRIVNIANALPDQVYEGIYSARSSRIHEKWGVTKTFGASLAPTGGTTEAEYIEGARGGDLSIIAPAMVLDGELLGATIVGPRQLRSSSSVTSSLPGRASLSLAFESQQTVATSLFPDSPTPPTIRFVGTVNLPPVTETPISKIVTLPVERLQFVDLPVDFYQRSGFHSVEITNSDGDFLLSLGVNLTLPDMGKLSVTGKNITLGGGITAPGGTLQFSAYNLSPYRTAALQEIDPLLPQPAIDPLRGTINVGSSTRLDVAGLITDDRPSDESPVPRIVVKNGGTISLEGYNVFLEAGSQMDVSGGVAVTATGKYSYGNAGSITIAAGQDLNYASVLGGKLRLGSKFSGYAGKGASGGSLSIKAPLVQIGGSALHPDTLLLAPEFFSQGGFQTFQLTGIGAAEDAEDARAASSDPDAPTPYIPAVFVAEGTLIQPVVASLDFVPRPGPSEPSIGTFVRPQGERNPASISFNTSTVRNNFYETVTEAAANDLVVVRGDILIGEGASVITEPGGAVTLRGSTVTVRGNIQTPGGTITIAGANSFPLDRLVADAAVFARPTVHIVPTATLSASGAVVMLPDAFGRRNPKVYSGGSIAVSGNIIAEAGAVLDVSGTSAVKDFHPMELGLADGRVPVNSGVTTKPYYLQTIPYQVESNGGSISFAGHEMLLTDATLVGRAGGPTAFGGTLAVSSGRFTKRFAAVFGSSINVLVTQNDTTLSTSTSGSEQGIGRPARGPDGKIVTGMGYFSADSFQQGGFDSLDLGFNSVPGAGLATGGNVAFLGPVTISAPGKLRVASGGVISANAIVSLSASYIAVGQPFSAPLTPEENESFLPFQSIVPGVDGSRELVPPTSGTGNIAFNAGLIDVGTLVFKETGQVHLRAAGGDIRGIGTLSVRGDLTLEAAQVYPASASDFRIFAYDPADRLGSVSIVQSGRSPAPLSAGGSLNIQASTINQGGTLVAPFGSITLGWNGEDLDPSTAVIDTPENKVVGAALPAPKTLQVTLQSGSLTSVSGVDYSTGRGLLIPFGLSPDGLTIIDPRGIAITSSGLTAKTIAIAGESVSTESGSMVDIRGGGELYSYRWINGNAGTIDYLGSPSRTWSAGTTYKAGELALFGGKTYSARTAIDPDNFEDGSPVPGITRYWSLVSESFAIVPGYTSAFSPFASFNTSDKATALGGDPGYVSSSLRVGDRITLDTGSGLSPGTYTLLPSRYALLPGAHLVTPQSGRRVRGASKPDESDFVTGYRSNVVHAPASQSIVRSVFEVASPEVLSARASYEVYGLSDFISTAAARNDIPSVQYLPRDSGYLSFHGNRALQLDGGVTSSPGVGGRGARIDISSFADMTIGTGQSVPGSVVLNSAKLSGFGAESLLIGGLRTFQSGSSVVSVKTARITVNNAGSSLEGPDITLVSRAELHVAAGSSIVSRGRVTEASSPLILDGDGALIRVSADPLASVVRTGITASNVPLLTVGAGALISGVSAILDSTYGFSLDSEADIRAENYSFAAGQISILLNGATALTGQIDPLRPQLILQGTTLANIQQATSLGLLSYQNTIDVYGPGSFGSGSLGSLSLQAGAIRGFNQGTSATEFNAQDIRLSNPRNVAAPAPGAASGSLVFNARTLTVGSGNLEVNGFANVILQSSGGILMEQTGGLFAQQSLTANTPVIVVARGARQNLVARGGSLDLNQNNGSATVSGGIGGSLSLQGQTVRLFTDVLVPSGSLSVEANGDIVVGGRLDASGTSKTFYDITRYTDGGEISLTSRTGNVLLAASSDLSVAANPGGGNAGIVFIKAGAGQFSALGRLDGGAGAEARGGSFELDIGSLASLDNLRETLNTGGFTESRSIRVRTGDLIVSGTTVTRHFALSADAGSITVAGTIDAGGVTGGSIALVARNNVILQAGSLLTTAAQQFSSAGKGGEIRLEAGTTAGGAPNLSGRVSLLAGSTIDLSVAEFQQGATANPNGSIIDPTSSAFYGRFRGTLHLRAPQISSNTDVGVDALLGTNTNASSILVEGYRVYTPAGGVLNTTVRNQINTDGIALLGVAGIGNANETNIRTRLLAGAPSAGALAALLVVAPGAEIVNVAGDLTLGLANPTGSTTAAAIVQAHTAADWDFSTFRYGSKRAAGVLTLRASGDILFNNALSDGFTPVTADLNNGWSRLWLAPLMTVNAALPVNTQSWNYRLTAGADLAAANFGSVLPGSSLAAGKGSILVGEFYPAVLNTFTTGSAAGSGANGQTADNIRFVNTSSDSTNRGTRYEVVRTGTGDISIAAGRDVQLRNQFATIYTAGVALPESTRIFQANDFVVPIVTRSQSGNPPADGNLGVIQQPYGVSYAMGGGEVSIRAQSDIGRFTRVNGVVVADTSRQIPTNWLYRRGYVDETGAFGVGGLTVTIGSVNDAAASTTWWIDYSNFFQGIGALGGGDVTMLAGRNIINADALIPTNARMAGRDPLTGQNLTPSESRLLELGGGDLVVRAGNNIDGGSYYVEQGSGTLFAGGDITTNSARSISRGILASEAPLDAQTWMPTLFYVGKSHFDASARGSALVGPVTNPFLLPQGMNNRFWYKTQFNTFSSNAGSSVASYGGSVTHRLNVTLPGATEALPVLYHWTRTQNLRSPTASANNQPWLRLAESSVENYRTMFSVGAPNLSSISFTGDINLVGNLILYPSPTGSLELLAAGGLPGLQKSGRTTSEGVPLQAWTSASVSLSDADPTSIPGITSPLAFQRVVGSRDQASLLDSFSRVDPLASVSPSFTETGAIEGAEAALSRQSALHSESILHKDNPNPLRIYTLGGDITGLTLYSATQSRIVSSRDINDIAFYLQNPTKESTSIISAGRDIILFNENSPLRSVAANEDSGNFIAGEEIQTSTGGFTKALAGDIQISGEGVLQVLAGRNIDLGTGANFAFGGLGRGITSIGRQRNPFLPFEGARLAILPGTSSPSNGAALGLRGSSLNFDEFIAQYVKSYTPQLTPPSADLEKDLARFDSLSAEMQAVVALDLFFSILKDSATEAAESGSYDAGYAAVESLFGSASGSATGANSQSFGWSPWESSQRTGSSGQIFTRVRDIRTTSGGSITLAAPKGGITMAPSIFGNPLTPPGIVTEFGGFVSIFMDGSLNIGQARVFTLRGGDLTIWSSNGDIAAGAASKTVVTAPPTRVTIDRTSALLATDLGGLATGGGIGVLASVEGVEAGAVTLIAPVGTVDAGDAGIRATGDITIAAAAVANADNISAGGTSTGVPSAPVAAAPNIGGLTAGSNTSAAASSAADQVSQQSRTAPQDQDETPSVIAVEVIGYGGSEEDAG